MEWARAWLGWPFRLFGKAFCFAVNLNGDQLRALCVWAMCGGIAVLGFTNIWHTLMVDHAVAAGRDHTPLIELATQSVRYNSVLQFIMVAGVVVVAAQLTSFKGKLGDMINVEAAVVKAMQQSPDIPTQEPPSDDTPRA
jgi:hypothetical protein